jgi:hypothetical protein
MKRVICLLLVIAFAGVMLLPVISHVNLSTGNGHQLADGNNGPLPPWPPSHTNPLPGTHIQMADGNNGPLPPWPPSHTVPQPTRSLSV